MARTIADKLDPELWEKSKAEAVARMGGVFSARAMQLAVQIYKARGGRYRGPKTGREGLSRWTAEDWQTRPGTPEVATRQGTTARYLPKAAWSRLTEAEQRATDEKKRRACRGVTGPCFVPNTPKAARAGVEARRGRASGEAMRIGSLFSGGGGWESGARMVGFTPAFAVELEPWIAAVHARVFGGHVVNEDVAKVDYAKHARRVGKLDVLVSSPPCQPTSKVGKAWATRRARAGLPPVEVDEGSVCDPNVGRYTVNATDAFEPEVVLLENNASYGDGAAFRHVVHELRLRGYFVDWALVRAEDYGIASGRERLIMRASKRPLPPWPKTSPRVSWWKAIADLVETMPKTSLANWQAGHLRDFPPPAGVPLLIAGGNPTRSGGRTIVWKTPDQPAWATQREKNTTGMRLVEPDGTVRLLSVRAIARLQGFPDDYPLEGLTRSEAIHLLGNSVPPILAARFLESFRGRV